MMHLSVILILSCLYSQVICRPSDSTCECGIENVSPRIIGGKASPRGMFPWLVYIQMEATSRTGYTVSQSCTGSIISDRHILTAAHCLHPKQRASEAYVWVIQGCNKRMQALIVAPLKVAKVYKHPNYVPDDDSAPPDDLAIFELKDPLQFNETFMPVCLSENAFSKTDDIENLVAAGWGKTKAWFFGLQDSDCLQHADMGVVSDEDCTMYWGEDIDIKKMMCAGGYTNICDGDSGGPLMTRSDGRVFQVGITSFGRQDCGLATGTPSGFERVSAHTDWIKKVTSKGQGVCFK